MKLIIYTALGSLLAIYTALGSLLASSPTFSEQDPPIPVGSLSVNVGMVRQGVAPMLSWDIQYPATVENVIEVEDPEEEITTKARLRVQVSMIGVSIGDGSGNQWPTKSWIYFSSVGWQHIFTGKESQVNPFTYYIDRIVEEGETIRFASKLNLSGYNYYYKWRISSRRM